MDVYVGSVVTMYIFVSRVLDTYRSISVDKFLKVELRIGDYICAF